MSDSPEYMLKIESNQYIISTGEDKIRTINLNPPKWQENKILTYLKEDYTIKIPQQVCKEINWHTGSKLWIEIDDSKLGQISLGKVFSGTEARSAMEHLSTLAESTE